MIVRVLATVALLASFALAILGCPGGMPAVTPRAEARRTVLAVTQAVVAGYDFCAFVAHPLAPDAKASLKKDCRAVLDPARESLEVAAPLVDAWDDAAAAMTACAIQDALAALSRLELVASDHGVAVPPAVQDGLVLARAFAPQCTTVGRAAAAPADAGYRSAYEASDAAGDSE